VDLASRKSFLQHPTIGVAELVFVAIVLFFCLAGTLRVLSQKEKRGVI
jgi:hypothetical protein